MVFTPIRYLFSKTRRAGIICLLSVSSFREQTSPYNWTHVALSIWTLTWRVVIYTYANLIMYFRPLGRLSQSPSLLISDSSSRYQGELAFACFELEKNFELDSTSRLTDQKNHWKMAIKRSSPRYSKYWIRSLTNKYRWTKSEQPKMEYL